jgi:hypothetical protein
MMLKNHNFLTNMGQAVLPGGEGHFKKRHLGLK